MNEYQFIFKEPLRLPPLGPPSEMHRSVVMNLLIEPTKQAQSSSVCILGAGPCNDLDLNRLLQHYESIHLVDLDGSVLRQGVEHQRVASNERITLWGDLDVSGIHDLLLNWSVSKSPSEPLDSCIELAKSYAWNSLPQQFDMIASTCLLSQLVSHIVETVGAEHPQFVSLIQTIRRRHLELMLSHLSVGGTGILIFDFLSSETLPRLATLSGDALKRGLSAAIDQGNYFHGMNPQVIHQIFEKDLKSRIGEFKLSPPWVWNAGARCYAVTAYRFKGNGE